MQTPQEVTRTRTQDYGMKNKKYVITTNTEYYVELIHAMRCKNVVDGGWSGGRE